MYACSPSKLILPGSRNLLTYVKTEVAGSSLDEISANENHVEFRHMVFYPQSVLIHSIVFQQGVTEMTDTKEGVLKVGCIAKYTAFREMRTSS
jgi:hypothetical protein